MGRKLPAEVLCVKRHLQAASMPDCDRDAALKDWRAHLGELQQMAVRLRLEQRNVEMHDLARVGDEVCIRQRIVCRPKCLHSTPTPST